MRISILMIAMAGMLFAVPANAQPGRGQAPDHVSACAELKGGTKGLYGLCVSFCARRDLSNVDLNDVASIKAASPDISTLRQYNVLRKRGDPEMPCFENTTPPDDDSANDDSGSGGSGSDDTGGSEPPPPAQCPCWTGAQLASIDGELPAIDGASSILDCTSHVEGGLVYKQQAAEEYDFGFITSVEGVAWASVDTGGLEPYNGCFFSNGVEQKSFPLEQADAAQCVQEVVNHCELFGNP